MSLEQMRRALDKIAHDAGFQPEDAYFIRGEFKIETTMLGGAAATLYADEGLNYCCDCATDLVAKARAYALDAAGTDEKARETAGESFDDNHRVVFTQLHQEDGSMQCEECRRTIDYALSENGFFAELDHYEGVQFDEKLLPGDAYAIARLIDALSVVKEDYDVDVDDEEDLLVELEALDLGYEYDRERAKEIERELAEHRSGEPKVRDLSTEERAIAVAERALALVHARSPAAPVC